jgi:hypothetical protein
VTPTVATLALFVLANDPNDYDSISLIVLNPVQHALFLYCTPLQQTKYDDLYPDTAV